MQVGVKDEDRDEEKRVFEFEEEGWSREHIVLKIRDGAARI